MAPLAATLLAFATFHNLIQVTSANAFRSKTPSVVQKVNQDNLKKTLLDEIEGQVGSATIRSRVVRLESSLKAMFESLPKNEHNKLSHSTVRYAIHRVFVQKHGWYIKGLDRDGGSWNETSHANILKDQAADFVQSIFEHRTGDRGLDLHELAVVAATLEHLIHDETDDRLHKAYTALRWDADKSVPFEAAEHVINRYLKIFILGEDEDTTMSDRSMSQVYPGWANTKTFARDILKETVAATADQSSLSFATVLDAVEAIADQYGRFQDGECRSMKNDLVSLGDDGVGRVPLSKFYQAALDGKFEFMESVDYLRSLGALDETNPDMPNVIVPNYVSSQSNCVVSTSYYSVCCMDECEGLMGQLERQFATPDVSPSDIAARVADMSSSSVTAPRTLSAPLLQKLDQIAESHRGTVPLHGRLFAQWMHHAFPRECPFPHIAGSTKPQTASEWIGEAGDAGASKSDMEKYVSAAHLATKQEELTHWTQEEELLVPRAEPRSSSSLWFLLRSFMLMAALVAVAFRAATTTNKASEAMHLPIYGDGKPAVRRGGIPDMISAGWGGADQGVRHRRGKFD